MSGKSPATITRSGSSLRPFSARQTTEQLGQVAHSYIHGGRYAKDIEVDIADVILCCLAYLSWLDKDASVAFENPFGSTSGFWRG